MREKVTEAGAKASAFFVGRVHNGPCLRPTGRAELSETDLRPHDPQHGWLHALAHGADAALCFALRCILPLPATTTAPRLTPTPGQPRPAARSSRPRRGRGGRLSCLQCCGWRFRPPRSDPGAAPSPFTQPVRASCKLPGI
ncbi:DUF2785 domain-containing protein [Deinococcus sp. PESE-13]